MSKFRMGEVCALHLEGQYVNYEINKEWVWYDYNWYAELNWVECTHVFSKVHGMMTLYLLTNGI